MNDKPRPRTSRPATADAGWQPGDRVALTTTSDPHTRLQPGDQGTVTRWDPATGQLAVRWDTGSTLALLLFDGDQARLLAPAPGTGSTGPDGTGPGSSGPAQEPAHARQDITDPATGLSRLLDRRCPTCILRPGDLMYLGPGRTAAFIRDALDAGSYVVCHQTLSYGDHPDYGPAICRGFFDAYRNRSPALLLLQAGRRLTEVPPPPAAKAGQPGRDPGKNASGRAPGANTPGEDSPRAPRGTEEDAPAVPGATKPPATPAPSPPAAPSPAPCPPATAPPPAPSGREPGGPPAAAPASSRHSLPLSVIEAGRPQSRDTAKSSDPDNESHGKNTAIRIGGKAIDPGRSR